MLTAPQNPQGSATPAQLAGRLRLAADRAWDEAIVVGQLLRSPRDVWTMALDRKRMADKYLHALAALAASEARGEP